MKKLVSILSVIIILISLTSCCGAGGGHKWNCVQLDGECILLFRITEWLPSGICTLSQRQPQKKKSRRFLHVCFFLFKAQYLSRICR